MATSTALRPETCVSPALTTAMLSAAEIARLGQAIYDQRLKALLEPAHNGQFVSIHIVNGDYFVNASEVDAILAARAAYPDEVFYMVRVGSPTALRI